MLHALGYDVMDNTLFSEGSELIAAIAPRGKDKY